MTSEPRRIAFEQLARNLHQVFEQVRVTDKPVLVERDGEVYRLEKYMSSNLWDGYDPQKARQGLRAAAGALAGADTNQLLGDLDAEREQDTVGRPA